jgi:hypothetical protein
MNKWTTSLLALGLLAGMGTAQASVKTIDLTYDPTTGVSDGYASIISKAAGSFSQLFKLNLDQKSDVTFFFNTKNATFTTTSSFNTTGIGSGDVYTLDKGSYILDMVGTFTAKSATNYSLASIQTSVVASVPEPSTYALAGLGLLALIAVRRKQYAFSSQVPA